MTRFWKWFWWQVTRANAGQWFYWHIGYRLTKRWLNKDTQNDDPEAQS